MAFICIGHYENYFLKNNTNISVNIYLKAISLLEVGKLLNANLPNQDCLHKFSICHISESRSVTSPFNHLDTTLANVYPRYRAKSSPSPHKLHPPSLPGNITPLYPSSLSAQSIVGHFLYLYQLFETVILILSCHTWTIDSLGHVTPRM